MLFRNGEGQVRSMPTAWTSLATPDPSVALAGGQSLFRTEDLQALVALLRDPGAGRDAPGEPGCVKGNVP